MPLSAVQRAYGIHITHTRQPFSHNRFDPSRRFLQSAARASSTSSLRSRHATKAFSCSWVASARALEGVPLGVKDLEEAAGLVCAHGSRLFEDHRVDEDSIQVARLVAAGAIVFGKTATPEFGSTAITYASGQNFAITMACSP